MLICFIKYLIIVGVLHPLLFFTISIFLQFFYSHKNNSVWIKPNRVMFLKKYFLKKLYVYGLERKSDNSFK